MSSDTKATRVGELRPSQIMWAFGVGALVDLPHLSVLVQGIDDWNYAHSRVISEDRLLGGVKSVLGDQVQRLLAPPMPEQESVRFDPFSAENRIGVPVRLFPNWLRCPLCGVLAEASSGLFQLKPDDYRPDRTRYVHATGHQGRPPTALPVRFLVACRRGHLDDFPWREFVHRGPTTCKSPLRFYEVGASLETANLFVACAGGKDRDGNVVAGGCGTDDRSMVEAFARNRDEPVLPRCRGRHPHLRSNDESCPEELKAILLGASNSWFPKALSALSIPSGGSELEQLVNENSGKLDDVEDLATLKYLRKQNLLGELAAFSDDEIWTTLEARRNGGVGAELVDAEDVDFKPEEWEILAACDTTQNSRDFRLARGVVPAGLDGVLSEVTLVEKIREVNALIGFSRIESPDELLNSDDISWAPISRNPPGWVPTTEVRGEGIFLRFDEERLAEWEARPEVQDRSAKLFEGHRGWRSKRQLDPVHEGFPGIRAVLLHTVAHLLMRELALDSGYSATSIRERVYADVNEETRQAGVLLYTAAPDSEGTLGGLVAHGDPESLGRAIRQALERAALCASDPLCSEHNPSEDATLHGAACHACAFAPETSCEFGNRYLDRALVAPTLSISSVGFLETVAT